MGTTLAFTGAYTLAGALTNYPNDPIAAFDSYENKMRRLVERAQKLPPGMPKLLCPETRWGIWLTFGILKILSITKVFGLLFLLLRPKDSEESVEDYGFKELPEWVDEGKI